MAVVFALSGLGVLIVETIWIRWLRVSLGATAPAASAALGAFLVGQALGAMLGARLASRVRRPLRTYAGLEVAGALAAAAVPFVLGAMGAGLDAYYDALREHPVALIAARLLVALVATLPAAVCFGATFPIVAQAVARRPERLGGRGLWLYASNTAGAAGGAALAAFWLPGAVGVHGSYAIGIGTLLLAAAAAAALGARTETKAQAGRSAERSEEREAGSSDGAGRIPARLVAIAALSGFGIFAGQLLLLQSFALVLNQSTHAVGVVLCVVLLSLALGCVPVAWLARRERLGNEATLGAALAVCAIAWLCLPGGFVAVTGLAYLGTDAPWPAYLVRALAVAAGVAGPALVCSGLVFPAALAFAGRAAEAAPDASGGRIAGWLVAANTVGAIAGVVLAPWVLLPWLGPWNAFLLLAVLYGSAAVVLCDGSPVQRVARLVPITIVALGLVVAGWAPPDLPLVRLDPRERLIDLRSTPSGVVAVVERAGMRRIQIDNHYALGGEADRVHQERQGHLPLVLHGRARRAAFLGAATGSSATAALSHDLDHVTTVELVPEVAAAARRHLRGSGGSVYEHPGTEVVLDDARNFVRATAESFDVIVGDLFVPWRSGAGALFTREHFAAARDRLAPQGLFCQWLPLYQLSEAEFGAIAAAFLDVFPNAQVFRGDFFGRHPIAALIGPRDALASADAIGRAAVSLAKRGVDDRWVTGPGGVFALYAGPLAAARQMLAPLERNTDDRPVIEYLAARTHAGAAGKRDPFIGLAWTAFVEQLQTAPGASPGWELPPAGQAAVQGGAALQRAGALYVAGRQREAARTFETAAARLAPHLIANAAPDPTAAELWWDLEATRGPAAPAPESAAEESP